ncbi:hypothetical protein LCGC14_1997240 [marine sediment metagenome]|uniref:Uncharacterized protein n=1 Tax=marine sediment metagenome TaxID=412755 RepID=A0A0F9I1D9_9ZZZZ
MAEEFELETKKSKYHGTFSQLYRLDSLWQLCHEFRKKGNLKQWNFNLDCVWTELASDAEKTDNEKFNEFIEKIIENKLKRNILYQILMEKEIFLRKLQNKQGKGTAYEDLTEDDLE